MINNTQKLDLKWMENAACKDMGYTIFMSENIKDIKLAKAICAGCLAIKECFDYALANYEKGIWGGTTEIQRRNIQKYDERSIRACLGVKPDQNVNTDVEK
jgi:WhiB family redox-sensing transcriptional regulator